MPVGRRLLFVGRGRSVARLSRHPRRRACAGARSSPSGVISAFAGVLYAGTLGSADPTSGLSFLLPAFAAAFLGATTILPGRFNPIGSIAAVYFLVTGHHRAPAARRADVRAAALLRRRARSSPSRCRRPPAAGTPADRLIEIDPAAVEDAILSLARHGAHGETGVWRDRLLAGVGRPRRPTSRSGCASRGSRCGATRSATSGGGSREPSPAP